MDISSTPIMCIDCLAMYKCLACSSATACDTCKPGYTPISGTCTRINCADPNCILCSGGGATACTTCNHNSSYYLVTPGNTCAICNSTFNMYINTTDPTYPCVLCSPAHCTTCASLT